MAPSTLADLRLAGALAMALVTLVTSDKVILTDCPKINARSSSVKLAHESDCTKYYGCKDGSKLEMQCPTIDPQGNRFYFNSVTEVCDWPKNVDCKRPLPIVAIPSRVPIPTKCPKYNSLNYTVHLAHEKDCTKFYKCNWGGKVLFDCPLCNKEGERLYFNPVLQVCDWPQKVHCRHSSSGRNPCSAYTSEETTLPSDGCIGTCPTDDHEDFNLLLPNYDGKKFCICSNGAAYVYDCPKDRPYWNGSEKKCALKF